MTRSDESSKCCRPCLVAAVWGGGANREGCLEYSVRQGGGNYTPWMLCFTPYNLHPALYSLYPTTPQSTPYTLWPTSYTQHHIIIFYTIHSTTYMVHWTFYTHALHHAPYTLCHGVKWTNLIKNKENKITFWYVNMSFRCLSKASTIILPFSVRGWSVHVK